MRKYKKILSINLQQKGCLTFFCKKYANGQFKTLFPTHHSHKIQTAQIFKIWTALLKSKIKMTPYSATQRIAAACARQKLPTPALKELKPSAHALLSLFGVPLQ